MDKSPDPISPNGTTGVKHHKNGYVLKLKDVVFGTKYELRAKTRTNGGTDSTGIVWVKKR